MEFSQIKKYIDIVLSSIDIFDSLSVNNYIKLISKILEYKIIPSKNNLIDFVKIHKRGHYKKAVTIIIELLIKYGLVIDMDILKQVIKNGYLINNLERFNIEYDEKLYYYCYIYKYIPVEYMELFKIDKNVLKMRELCCSGKQKKVIFKFMKKNNLKPDGYCYENASYSSPKLFGCFEKQNCEPTVGSLMYNSLKRTNYSIIKLNNIRIRIYERLEDEYKFMMKPNEDFDVDKCLN